jgi:hypothetical protein
MKKVFFALSAAAILTAGIIACNKQNPVVQENLEQFEIEGKSANNNVESTLGRRHNQYLERVGRLNVFPEITRRDLYNEGVKDAEKFREQVFDFEFFNSALDLAVNQKTLDNMASHLLNEGLISQALYDELLKIDGILNQIQSSTELNKKLLDNEKSIQRNSLLSSFEKDVAKGTSTIARYSSQFWSQAISNKQSPWHTFVMADLEDTDVENDDTPQLKINWKKLAKFGLDVVGFTGGAVLGNALCGPPCGAAGGALVGNAASGLI